MELGVCLRPGGVCTKASYWTSYMGCKDPATSLVSVTEVVGISYVTVSVYHH